MSEIKCNVCEHKITLPPDIKEGGRFTCPKCFAQLALGIEKGKKVAKCAVCTKNVLECSPDCERKLFEKEKRGFFDIKL